MNMTWSLRLIVAAGAIAVTTSNALAQAEPAECARVRAELRARPNSPDAIWLPVSCPSTGPAALAELWTTRGAGDGNARMNLVEATASLRDPRLFDVIARIAAAADRPRPDRLAALLVLMRYYDPRYGPGMEDLAGSIYGASVPMNIHSPAPVTGPSPATVALRRQIGALFARLAASDDDAAVRTGAGRLRQVLARRDPANTILPDGAITLVAGCGTRVTFSSTADVEIDVQLRVLDTPFQKMYGISAGSVERPRSHLLSLPAGTVVASYGGREVARLTERKTPCPPGTPW
jgi:hypothetical protein